jgi:hypothetical protein
MSLSGYCSSRRGDVEEIRFTVWSTSSSQQWPSSLRNFWRRSAQTAQRGSEAERALDSPRGVASDYA